ncbi:hypothetical protein, partial [Amycolatopsis sp. NPDC003676]
REKLPQVGDLAEAFGERRPFLESGRIRPLSPSVLLSLFAGPIVLFNMAHIVNRQPLSAADFEPIAKELAEAFVRAVGAP